MLPRPVPLPSPASLPDPGFPVTLRPVECVHSHESASSRWLIARLVAAAVGATSIAATAQPTTFTVSSGFSASQSITDNRDLSATDRRADAVTTLTPSVRISSRAGRLQGSLDYALSGVYFARSPSRFELQNALTALLTAELIEGHGYLDVNASISRQAVSALALQGARPNAINRNSTEVRRFSVSPRLAGGRVARFDDVQIEASANSSMSYSPDNGGSNTANYSGGLRVSNGGGRLIGWAVDLNRSVSDFEAGRRTTQDTLRATVSYAVLPELRLSVNGGKERNNVQSLDGRLSDTWGGGLSWQPTARTQIAVQGDRRYFGNSYSVSASHRFRRSSLSFSDSRNSTEITTGAGQSLSNYEIFFAQFASLEPDPVRRDTLVRSFLRASGLDPNQRLTAGFLSAALSLQRTQNLSYALQGLRNSVVLTAFTTTTRRLDTLSTGVDDLSQVDVLRQRGFSLSWSYRLTPTSSLVVTAAEQRTPGRGAVVGNGLKSVDVSWGEQLSSRSNLSVSASHVRADGANPYTESAVTASFGIRF